MNRRARILGIGGIAASAITVIAIATAPPPPSGNCDLNATTSNFAAQVSAASAGQTICLASGSYGDFAGTNKAITIKNAAGATPTMGFNFGSGDSGFTLDGMSGMGGDMAPGASNITIKNGVFTGSVCVTSPGPGLVFDTITMNNVGQGCGEGRMTIENGGSATILNSHLYNTNTSICSDGVTLQGPSSAQYGTAVIRNTEIGPGLLQAQCNGTGGGHIDSLQLYGGRLTMTDSYLHGDSTGIMSPDGAGIMIDVSNNVIDTSDGYYSMCLGGMTGAQITHNYLASEIGLSCTNVGASSGNTIRNNVTDTSGGGSNTISNNVSPGSVSIVGGPGRCGYKTPTAGLGSDGTLIGLNDCP